MTGGRAWRAGLALLAVLFVATAAWSGVRYHLLGAQIDAGRDSLRQQLAVPAGDTVDASVHVARVVEANDGTFDHLVLLSTARRLALMIALACTFGAFCAALAARTALRAHTSDLPQPDA